MSAERPQFPRLRNGMGAPVPLEAVTQTGSGHTRVTRGLESASHLYHHRADKRAREALGAPRWGTESLDVGKRDGEGSAWGAAPAGGHMLTSSHANAQRPWSDPQAPPPTLEPLL